MLSTPAAELQGRDLIFQPALGSIHSVSSTQARPAAGTAGSTRPGPSAAARQWEETTYKGLITERRGETLERREEGVEEEVCSGPTPAVTGLPSGQNPPPWWTRTRSVH